MKDDAQRTVGSMKPVLSRPNPVPSGSMAFGWDDGYDGYDGGGWEESLGGVVGWEVSGRLTQDFHGRR